MSTAATHAADARLSASRPVPGWQRLLTHSVTWGLLTALVVGLLLSVWFGGQARDALAAHYQERDGIIHASALEALVTAQQDAGSDAPALQGVVTAWAERHPDISNVRVLRLRGSRLLASTVPADAADELPRRLARAEKPFYDLGQELRASVETNRDEGVFRKEHIQVDRLAPDTLRLSVPYRSGEQVVGMVQLTKQVTNPVAAAPLGLALLLVAGALVGFLILTWALTGGGSRLESVDVRKPWLLAGVAAAVFSAAMLVFGPMERGAVDTVYGDVTAALAETHQAVEDNTAFVSGLNNLAAGGPALKAWDVDVYQRPLNVIEPGGVISQSAMVAAAAQWAVPLSRGLWGNWAAGLVLLAIVALGYGRRLRKTIVEHHNAYLYCAPAMFGMLLLVFFPFLYGITLGFTNQTIFTVNEAITTVWVGLQNYVQILGDFDVLQGTAEGWVVNYQNFYWTLFITVCWTVFNVTIGVSVGMALALTLNTKGLAGKSIYRILLILPWAIPNYITALIWKGMFHPTFGVINQAIQMFGGEPVAWFDGVLSAFITGIATNGWLSFPFMMVVILGALQSISADMYEAARIDGATRWQQFRYITVPLLKPTLIPAVIISVVWTFNMFNIIYLVSEGQPAGANEILITQAYKIAFEKYQYGYAAAYSVVIFGILLVYGVFQTRMTRATEAANA